MASTTNAVIERQTPATSAKPQSLSEPIGEGGQSTNNTIIRETATKDTLPAVSDKANEKELPKNESHFLPSQLPGPTPVPDIESTKVRDNAPASVASQPATGAQEESPPVEKSPMHVASNNRGNTEPDSKSTQASFQAAATIKVDQIPSPSHKAPTTQSQNVSAVTVSAQPNHPQQTQHLTSPAAPLPIPAPKSLSAPTILAISGNKDRSAATTGHMQHSLEPVPKTQQQVVPQSGQSVLEQSTQIFSSSNRTLPTASPPVLHYTQADYVEYRAWPRRARRQGPAQKRNNAA